MGVTYQYDADPGPFPTLTIQVLYLLYYRYDHLIPLSSDAIQNQFIGSAAVNGKGLALTDGLNRFHIL